MGNFQGKASMYPLDYTDRIEHAVLLYPKNWADLYDLFTYPNMYLANAFHSFIGTVPPQWRVHDQVSFIIEPLPQNQQSLALINECFHGSTVSQLDMNDIFGGQDKNRNSLELSPTLTVQKNINRLFNNGGSFVCVQFAVNSGVIHVTYVPPLDNTKPSSSIWFTGETKPFTLSHGGDAPAGSTRVDLSRTHFDVESDRRTLEQINSFRARIALDMMENPERLNEYLKKVGTFYESTVSSIENGNPMPPINFERRVFKQKPAPSRPEEAFYEYAADAVGPQIFIENAFSDPFMKGPGDPIPIPPPPPVCGQVYCTKNGKVLTVNRVEQKYYYQIS